MEIGSQKNLTNLSFVLMERDLYILNVNGNASLTSSAHVKVHLFIC